MADKKVKIGNILDNLLPEFITTNNNLFVDFLKQYYISEERDYGTIYLIDYLSSFKNVESFAELLIGAINPATGQPFVPIQLTKNILHLDETINVNTTIGFPNQYGLLRIENEIITYTGKTATSFTGCVRGFSGVSSIESSGNQEYLTFSSTDVDDHSKGTLIQNLNFVYLQEFYRKHKYQFLPGFEERQFQNVSIENILSRAKDFFSSKGTETALKILFNVLFAKKVEISKPFDKTIQPSSAEWVKSDDIIVEAISGDPKKLESTTLSQDSVQNPTASGAVASIDEVFLGAKKYFKISFAPEPSPRFGIGASPSTQFSISKKTKVLQSTNKNTVVTVDSTMGFPEEGSFYYFDGLRYNQVLYLSKNYNQFLDCDGIGLPLQPNTEISDIRFVYGFENGNENQQVIMRVVGTVSDIRGKSSTKYFKEGDSISLKSFGEKYDDGDVRFNKWFYNNVSYVDVESLDISALTFTTKTKHYINQFDKVDILLKNGSIVSENINISAVTSENSVRIESITAGLLNEDLNYVLRKRIGYAVSDFDVESGMSNIQNSFTDKDGNCYVMFSGFPSYPDIQVPNRSVGIQTGNIDTTGTGEITINDHGFENGEMIYYNPAEDTTDTAGVVSAGTYIIKVVDSNTIKLGLTHPEIENDIYVLFQTVGISTHVITPNDLYSFKDDSVKSLKPQNHFRRLYKNPQKQKSNRIISGPIGVSLNGIEFYSPVGSDSYNYGQIDGVDVISSGSGYNVNSVPEFSVSGGIGLTAFANCSGHIDSVDLISAGFDYVGTPSVKVQGGNSSGTVLEAKMRGFTHTVSVNDFAVSLSNNTITQIDHKFLNGEEVTYISSETPIGITSANVGFSTTRLSSGSSYFIVKVDDNTFSLSSTLNDAVNGTKIIDFNSFGTKDHSFRSKKIRNIIDRVDIIEKGNKISTRRVEIDSQAYPPEFAKDEFKTFTGINIHQDYIYAKNHGFSDGEVVSYKTTNNISGLDSNSVYKVKVLDGDKFKLAHAGTATTVSITNYEKEIYVNITDVGAGIHTLGYPEMSIIIDGVVSIGNTSAIPSYYNATATTLITGTIDDIFIKNGGHSFGNSELLNYDKRLSAKLLTGKDAVLKPLVNSDGEIDNVYVLDGGSEYTTPPKLTIDGDGNFAELKAIISGGKITAVTILNKGKNYKDSNTSIVISSTGNGAKFITNVHKWYVNDVERYKTLLSNPNFKSKSRDYIVQKSSRPDDGTVLVGYYAGKFYRSLFTGNSNIDSSLDEETDATKLRHSPIVGWAYDGNPIYGPYAQENPVPVDGVSGSIKRMQSSYKLDAISDSTLRPPKPDEYFVQDFVYNMGSGDLDEYNGRFCETPEFQEGRYVYFSTMDQSSEVPSFPYITKKHHNATDLFNYDYFKNQSDKIINTGDYYRMVTHLGINDDFRDYPFLSEFAKSDPKIIVKSITGSNITGIDIIDRGHDYKINEKINFTTDLINAQIKEIRGKKVETITTNETENNSLSLSVTNGKVTAISAVPHTYANGDVIEITGVSTETYKNIEGFYKVGVASATSVLSTSIGTTSVTGIVTSLTLFDSPVKGKFFIDDIIVIGTEKMKIIGVDAINGNYKVSRKENGLETAHSAGAATHKEEYSFNFEVNKKLNGVNFKVGTTEYFSPESSVGVGSQYSSVIVGTAGSFNITKSIPPRAIYIRNHSFKSGDELEYVSYGGSITASHLQGAVGIGTTNSSNFASFGIHQYSNLFAVKLGTDFLGVSTERVGVATNYLHFVAADGDNAKFTKKVNKITADSKRRNATILTGKPHGLIPGDKVTLDVTPSITDAVVFRYNENIRRLIVDPLNIDVTGVSTTGISTDVTSAITIEDHDFNNGDAVSYVASTDIIGGLQNNGHIYYAIKYSNNKIRLAENYSSATSYPAQYIDFLSVLGSGTFQLGKVDPKIVATKGTKVSIAVSDTTLANYDIKFYTDKDYRSRYDSKLIERRNTPGSTNAVVNVSIADSLPNILYYKVEGASTNIHKTKDNFTVGESAIIVENSKYNGSYDVIGCASTTFTVNLHSKVENASYIQSGLSTAFYYTTSASAIGGIHSLDIFDYGKNIKTLPVVTSVGTTTGYGAEFVVESDGIGTILDTKIKFSGIEIPEDKTLTPKAKSQILLTLDNNLKLSEVGVTSGGKNYNTAPKIIIPGHPDASFDAKILGNAIISVDIISGSSGLNENTKVVSTNNSNGINVIGAVSIGNTENRLSIKSPQGGFTNLNPFPFDIGDDIFVENVSILTNTGTGYNSSDYNYKNFTITGINTTNGAESITYSIVGFAQSGGIFDTSNSFGTVVKSEDLPSFEPIFDKAIYKMGETVTNQSNSSATVVDFETSNNTLKITDVNGTFTTNDIIVGNASNFKSSVSSLVEYDFELQVSSTFQDIKTWRNDVGHLNNDQQRLHDNDFYQRFSYAVRGPISYDTWSEPVNSLAHVSGYKNFAEYEISNIAIPSVGMTTVKSDIGLNLVLLNEASVHDLFFYDFVSEDTNNPNFSRIVKFDSKIITDYNKSITNKVLMIDDISSQFTGITTSIGGGIIGLSTFTLLNDSNTMLNHVFNPSTAIDTSTGLITINEHNFHTGERLVYTQDSSPIGIAATHSIGIGINTTVNLPGEVYVVKVTDNTFRLSMGSSETQFNTPHTIGFATVTGLGTEHSLAVESELAITRGLITIDNMIQSPIARKNITVGLASAIGSTHAEIYVNDPTKFVGNSLLKVDDEIFKISAVGIGSTNSLSVERGFMGTSPTSHLVGAALTALSGDYRIQKGKIHFNDAPYVSSKFNGRIFYRLNYNSNKIVDDISEEFNGTKDKFDLTVNTEDASGINTSFGAFLINNIFQRPFYSDVGSLQKSDYTLNGGSVGAASTIDFTGTLPDDLPKGGIINQISTGSTAASGYQIPRAGSASTVFINGSGNVTSVGIGSSGGGAGYLIPPKVSIASTTGVGAAVTAIITNGAITSFDVVAAGSGYLSASPPTVIITPPAPYKNLPTTTTGNGSGATLNVIVGVGGSILNYELADNGIGYEVDDVIELTGLEFQSVGVSTFPLRVTVASKYQDKFAGWTFGQLLELDDFSPEFNGVRKDFYITRTVVNKEFYSIVSDEGSDIVLQNNMLMFINDVLQKPGIDYSFIGGTKLTFVTPPDRGSKFKLYFYTGSDADYESGDVNQTIKVGDSLRLQKWTNGVVSQTNRTIYELSASDTVETEIYGGIGISTDGNFIRPTMWRKQTSDLIVNGLSVSKKRDYLEPKIFPNTNIIAGVAATHNKIWVKDAWSFNKTDDLGGILDDILIVGVGTTGNAITESINGVTFAGDYCKVIGIKTETTGINTSSPMIVFDVIPDPQIFDLSPSDASEISRSGINTGDYFVIDKTLIGSGVTAIFDSPNNTLVGESTDFINGVYYAHAVVSIGSSGVRISSNVQSLSGISTAGLSTYSTSHGCMSWGSMSFTRNAGVAKTFTAQTGRGNIGLSTSTYIRRKSQYKLSY